MKLRTSNTSEPAEMRLSATICTANIAEAVDGAWVPVAPYGEHPSPDGSYVQRFSREQADKVVATWNSITGMAARAFKNLWHGLGSKMSCPVWDGHPETDKARWPKAKLLAEITDLRTGNDGLEGRIRWTGNARPRGPLYPSPLWWHLPPAGEPPAVFPELLESVGLVASPNISSVPAWTQNASPNLAPEGVQSTANKNQNHMNEEQLKALRLALNLPESADAAKVIETAQGAYQLSTSNATALQTANAAKVDLENQLITANASVSSLTTERDSLKTANAELTTANGALVKGVLDLAEKRGAITPAERTDFEARINTANTAAAALTELQTRKAMNVQAVEINGNRVDLSTANARADALEAAISKRMKDENLTRDQAFAKCQADPGLSGLFGAMSDPTRKS